MKLPDKKRILVLGNFGYSNHHYDGQTIKTRTIYQLFVLKTAGKTKIETFDTQTFKNSKFSVFTMLWKLFRCSKLVYLPAHNNLKFLFPIIYVVCRLKRCEILYFVIGGWVAEYLRESEFHVRLLSKIKAILSESSELSDALISQYHFKNVITLHNFRIHSYLPSFPENEDEFKIVFMARINRLKGLEYVFRLAEYFVTNSLIEKPVLIDFYGPIEERDRKYFDEQLNKYENTFYKGVLKPDQIYQTLNSYDLMVLPTRYFTEGFPGSVLDAYISGIPVVATHWKHATDFIVHRKTGLIVPFENSERAFIEAVVEIYENNDLLRKMKYNAYEQSLKYSSDQAWEILINNNLID